MATIDAVISDFDGTLSHIVDDPADARPVPGAAEVLSGLVGRLPLVAIVSGRSLHDLRVRLDIAGVLMCGSYGRERSDRPPPVPSHDWDAIEAEVLACYPYVERKPDAVALHWRKEPDLELEARRIAAEMEAEHELCVRPGRMVVELTEPGGGKADVILDLIAEHGLRHVVFAGDDRADLEAFERLDGHTKVAVASPESPAGLLEDADIVLDGPDAYVDWLRRAL